MNQAQDWIDIFRASPPSAFQTNKTGHFILVVVVVGFLWLGN
jgi:hypothetical protein